MDKWSVRKYGGTWCACDHDGLAQYESPQWESALLYAVMGSEGHSSRMKAEASIRKLIETMNHFRKGFE